MADGQDTVQRLGRLGLVARGLLYIVVGVLAANIARGSSRQADKQGALQAIGATLVGRVALVAVAVGFAGYALWRFAEATVRPGDKGVLSRLGSAARAVLYTSFCVTTLSFVVTQHTHNTDRREQDVTARVLHWPAGRLLVAAAGLALIGAGVANAWRVLTGAYRKHLKEEEISRRTLRWLKPVAYAGLAARMVAFCLVGAFLVQSAVTYDPEKARGLDGSLRAVARTQYGEELIVLVAIGLIAFGGWSFVQARYREVLGT